jgi:hypothetical protein
MSRNLGRNLGINDAPRAFGLRQRNPDRCAALAVMNFYILLMNPIGTAIYPEHGPSGVN